MVAEGFAARSVAVIYNGIDPGPLPDPAARARTRQALGVTDGHYVIGTIGRLDPVKDFSTLIGAVSELPPALNATLVIVGDGPERAQLEQTAASLAANRVQLLGHRNNAREWLAGFDVFVNSSISEGISLTILEAMAAGLPVIATRVGGTPEVVDESCGRLIPSRDRAALSAMLLTLAQQPEDRRQMGRRARERVQARFTLERMIGEYRDVYRELTGVKAP
jgi:glycosyltransferase involved in cell wall biosynthesis